MMWSFLVPARGMTWFLVHHDAREMTLGRLKSVTGKFRMTFSPEILTFSLKLVKFNPGTAGKLTKLPAVN